MDKKLLIDAILLVLSSSICGALASVVTTLFVKTGDRRRILNLETEVEAIDAKISRRTQRENLEKAHVKKQDTDSIEAEALQRVNNRIESPTSPGPGKNFPGLHQGFYKR